MKKKIKALIKKTFRLGVYAAVILGILVLYLNFGVILAADGRTYADGSALSMDSPYDCVIREVKEETSLDLIFTQYRAVVTFNSDEYESEQMHLFTCTEFTGQVGECNEGELCWIDKTAVKDLNMWNGDLVFLDLLDTRKEFFSLKLSYKGEELQKYYIDGKKVC